MGDVEMVAALVKRIEKEARASAIKAAVDNYPMTWVKLDRYVELSGDTADSVQSRRKAGKWLDGEQCKIVDGRLWINLPAVDEWIEKWDQRSPARAASNSVMASAANRSESNSCTAERSAGKR
jgi:hypothetical protein